MKFKIYLYLRALVHWDMTSFTLLSRYLNFGR